MRRRVFSQKKSAKRINGEERQIERAFELNTSSRHCGLADTQPSRAILRDELGFRKFCTFEKMRPVFHRL